MLQKGFTFSSFYAIMKAEVFIRERRMLPVEVRLNTALSFAVPVTVTDHLLKLATFDQLKVLLFVLRHAGETLPDEVIARSCNVSVAAVEEAIVFWQNVNVLSPDAALQPTVCRVQQSAPQTTSVPEQTPPPPAAEPEPKRAAAAVTSNAFHLMPAEIAERKRSDKVIAEMLTCAERSVGRMLNHTELKSIIWMHEYLGLSPDIILMLVAYCVEIGEFHVRAMECIAVTWQENGISTHALAQEDIRRRTDRRSFTGKVMQIFEMQRHPTTNQQKYIDGWQQSGMSAEMIRLAYEKSRDSLGDKFSFAYIDKIIKRWNEAGVTTPEQAALEDERFRADKQSSTRSSTKSTPAQRAGVQSSNSSIDMDELMKKINQF